MLTFPFRYYSQHTLLSPLSQDILRFFDISEVQISLGAKNMQAFLDGSQGQSRAASAS